MQNSRNKEKQSYFNCNFLWIIVVLSFFLICPDITLSAEKYHYYLHTGSFRTKKDTIKFIGKLKKHGYKTVAKYKKIGDMGYWYQVYIGPISSKKEVNLTTKTLRRKKIAKHIAVHQKRALLSCDLKTRKQPAVKKAAKPKKTPAQVSSTKITEFSKRGIGRNMARGEFAMGYRHLYRDVETEITKRKSGSSIVSVSESEKDDFPTSMHIDSLYFRYGFTDFLEIFIEAGGGYKELSSTSPVYGGGLQLSLFEVESGMFKGLYGSLKGAYLCGDVEYEYDSPSGNKWNKEAEFTEFSAMGELGFSRPRFAVYLGGVFLKYNETAERQQLTGPSLTSFTDELENKNNFGACAGAEIYLTPSVLVKVEGEVISRKSIFGAIEYHF